MKSFPTNNRPGLRVLVGMSGGVDSSVAALCLRDAGYDVAGITMRLKPRHMLNDAQAAASLAEDFYYEQGIALVADAQLSIPSPCFIYSAGAHAWLGQSGAALRRDTVMYIRGRDCGLPGLYADGFDVLLPYWLEKWRPANCSTGSFAAMLYQATGNRRLLTLRITGFTQAGRPVYAAPESLLRAQTG